MNYQSNLLRSKWILILLAPIALTYGVYSISQVAPPNIRAVDLTADPLYAQGSGQKPTLTLALSVEFPTVGAQYRDNYDINLTYPGYFNSEKCYNYNKTASLKHFFIEGSATNHSCEGSGFSGNFLNWSASSAIDILRLGLTGGDRIEDTATSTILQRAVIPTNFYDSGSYFPQKNISNAVARKSIPASFFAPNDTNTVRISNCLEKVHIFSSGVVPQNSGQTACENPEKLLGPILEQVTGTSQPAGYAVCANEGSSCDFSGYREVIFGTSTKWSRRLAKNGVVCNTATLGDPASGSTKKCYVKSTTLTFPMEELAGENFLYARAKVCDSSDSRQNLCQRYPNGNLKPVGNMQKYSDRLRLAAFGYLMDNNRSRYGGVLRAPMTYVGPKSYDANGNPETGTNSFAEWNENTGVFSQNPRNASEGISGVINYLNRFGRTGPTPGVYKSLDPLGELYYESLRYLQGLQPTSGAVSGLTATDSRKDGYPVYSSWIDPFDGGSSTKNYACLRNSILTIGDKNTHSDKSLPGNTRTDGEDYNRTTDVSLAANIPNFVNWTSVVGGFESGNSVSYIDGTGVARASNNPTTVKDTTLANMATVNTGSNSAAYYMAGAAYWANTHDIRGSDWTAEPSKQRPGMRVTTYVLDVNENSASFEDTTRRRSQLFLTAKYGGFNDVDGDGNPYTPANDQGIYNSRHWEKETEPGEAKTYFLASNANAVLKALDDIFVAATKVSNTISTPATSSNQLSTADGYYYIASFDAERWSGDLKRNTVKLDANGNVALGDVKNAISAAKKLDQLSDTGTNDRKIFVGLEGSESTGGSASAFIWADINSTLQGHLNKAGPTAAADGIGEGRLAFLRGNRGSEGTTFRLRNSRLGDIVNSGAVYSAAPTTRHNGIPAYKTFYTNNKNRTKAVFVGANDGMLHAFNADTMDELFAYIPSWLGSKLSGLTSTSYNSSGHASYVDAVPVVGEAEVGSAWKTVLLSGTGGGGQGVFALDVTDPTAFNADSLIWEFTDANDPDLGNVVGQPQIVKLRTSAANVSPPTYKWFAAVAGGVNNYVNDGTGKYSTTGKPALFLLDLSKPKNTAWALGTNYFKVSLPISNSVPDGTQELDASGNGTGQGKATGIINFDYTNGIADAVEFFYLGDLHGQFWKLDMSKADLSSSTEAEWNLQKLSAYKNGSDQAIPMYIAKDSGGKVQPISMVPTIAYGPEGSYILGFGTGKYLEARDNTIDTRTQTQSFYVLFDSGNNSSVDTEADTEGLARFNGRSRLQQGTIATSTGAISMSSFYWNTPKNSGLVSGVNKKAGWFIDFPRSGSNGGERQITSAALFGQTIMFSSVLPPSSSQNACGGGASYFYKANLASGLGQITTVSNGAQGAPMVFNVGSTVSNSDSVGARIRTDKAVFGRPGAAGDDKIIFSDPETATSSVGRLSWRQINNYRELKLKDASSW
jgi:type IV pilus assembly protein PilY1